jgi:hypothetical protein
MRLCDYETYYNTKLLQEINTRKGWRMDEYDEGPVAT